MGDIVHARLDEETRRILTRLCRQTGLNPSEIIRRGIKALTATTATGTKRRIVGVGKFASGIPDLGSNKEHLEGFGRR
jgi:hypothetical protein